MTELRATARLQFHKEFTFDQALALLDYFAELGISHIYASPILKARPGSMHGYDVVDPGCVNPELGGEEALQRLVRGLRERNMGLIVDFVPNHMAVGGADNPWWLDVLEWGMRSPYAQFFDIQWNSPDPLLKGQPLVPFLRTDYGEALRTGEITLHFDCDKGAFYAKHFDHHFPLHPPSYSDILDVTLDPALGNLSRRFQQLGKSPDYWQTAQTLRRELSYRVRSENLLGVIEQALSRFQVPPAAADPAPPQTLLQEKAREENVQRLHQLLELQNYRLASWRTAADDINWRRFFDINELAGLRMERIEVFEAVHKKMFELIGQGLVDGLRIDHIDGLANPRAYCRRLRQRIERLLPQRPGHKEREDFYLYVEKILAADEHLPQHWYVDGTTGYEFMNQVSLLQHDPAGAQPLTGVWHQISGRPADFRAEVIEARRLILSTSLSGDFEAVAQNLLLIARTDINTRDLTLSAIRRALFELVAHFPVYRTYAAACPRSAQDQAYFTAAISGARASLAENDWQILDYLDRWLGGEPLHQLPPGAIRELRQKTLARFQQLTSPAAAKATEDTAFYRYAALLSRNDVGSDPAQFAMEPAEFHRLCSRRLQQFPDNLLTTATHDHKRGEDTRARLAVVSEKAEWFAEQLAHWRFLAAPLHTETEEGPAPSPGDEIMLYQTLLATWPLDLDPQGCAGAAMSGYVDRLLGWQEKALREAKLRSHWNAPNSRYEAACRKFLTDLLQQEEMAELRGSIARAAMALAPAGAINSLSQALLRMTTPGVPDLYQGTEFWDFTLVDPDNRRPVDFAQRVAALETGSQPKELLRQWRDGHIKQFVIRKTLRLRQQLPELFQCGEYIPLQVAGECATSVFAFSRSWQRHRLLVLTPRLPSALLADSDVPLVPAIQWRDTRLVLPPELAGIGWRNLFTQRQISDREPMVRELLAEFPIAVCISDEAPHSEGG